RFPIGQLLADVLHTPGHTPACVTYVVGDAAFVGDTLFMPDYGTARADFPGGDPVALYRSIRRILDLPEHTRIFTAHDYKAPGREAFAWESTVAEQRARNVHIHDGVSEADFVALRKARDATLSVPRLLLPSVQVNIRAGQMPPAENDGGRYLKIPIDRF
ncbi:MAG TPA: MBL fold metallo-hydrolase, partial [Acetobacteraceae bacterium]